MAKDPSPLLGYNNNIRHKNRVFHIQTEDSGVRHPHVITHLFMDGGRILKSVKTSYAEHLGVERMGDVVRKMMKDQHKGMLIALRDGQFDVIIDGGDAPKPAPKPATPSMDALVAAAPSKAAEVPLERARTESAIPSPAGVAVPPLPPPPAEAPQTAHAPPPLPPARPAIRSAPAVAEVTARVERAEPVDILELEDSSGPMTVPEPPLDLTPPPANLFRPRTGGNYSELGDPSSAPPPSRPPPVPPARGTSRPPTRPPAGSPSNAPGALVSKSPGLRSSGPGSSRPGPTPAAGSGGSQRPAASLRRTSSPPPPRTDTENRAPRRPAAPAVAVAKPSESRYASARPAAIFGQAKPRGGSSIFGEDIISDKSLDEVIMSYLADDVSGASEGGKAPAGRPVDPKRRK